MAPGSEQGKLKIGDDWNAISIIALSQSNPLKAVAEFVENSIDAGARRITVTRGKERGEQYLRVVDDGEGIPKTRAGIPNFKYVATHICDSVKRKLKAGGARGIQGEFGIGLLSFWTVGQRLSLLNSDSQGRVYEMLLQKGDPDYRVRRSRRLYPVVGTELTVKPLLAGIKSLSGEKIQWYLASELRDRIRNAEVQIKVVDRAARKELRVEPRRFGGTPLRQLPEARCSSGQVYLELYLTDRESSAGIGLYRSGTRVLRNLAELEHFDRSPWTDGRLEGIVDAPFLGLTPGTRLGVIRDEAYAAFEGAMDRVSGALQQIVDEQRRAEEEQASREILKSVRKALREALLTLPAEEYDGFRVQARSASGQTTTASPGVPLSNQTGGGTEIAAKDGDRDDRPQKEFFEFAGPLFSVQISPASSVVRVGESRTLRALPRDRSRRRVEEGLTFEWQILEGGGRVEPSDGEIVKYEAPAAPGLTKISVTTDQGKIRCRGEALVTVTATLIEEAGTRTTGTQGLPGYTFERAPGELWRSRLDEVNNVVVINSGHRDFVFASRTRALKLRYIVRLFAKQLVLHNFPGLPPEQLLERLVELSLYAESKLR